MSPGRTDAPQVAPEPVVSVPLELDDTLDTPTPAAAAVVSLPGLVFRRLAWSVAPVLAWLAEKMGQAAAAAVRRETAAKTLLLVARYERQKRALRMKCHEWQTKAETLQLEADFLTKLHRRTTAAVQAETVAYKAAEDATIQRARGQV